MADFVSQYGVLIVALIGCGLFSGVAAGLFGIGGGAIIVPVLIILFESLGFSETASHVAIATSLATIILTSARSNMQWKIKRDVKQGCAASESDERPAPPPGQDADHPEDHE